MILGHKIALRPTVEQRIDLTKAAGCARFAYNWGLAEGDRIQKECGTRPGVNKLKKLFNSLKHQEFPWIGESPKDANQEAFENLGKAWSRYFDYIKLVKQVGKKAAGKRVGPPVFKKKGKKVSFYVSNDKFWIKGQTVKLPVIGKIKLCEELRFPNGRILGATVSRTADTWSISVKVDVGPGYKVRRANGVVGIDLGITTAMQCSDGTSFKSPKPLKKYLKKLARVSRQHSRKQKGSNNRKKAARRLARLHLRIANIRKDWQHKATTEIARKNQVVCLEDLNTQGMLANHKLARALSDIGFYEIRRQLGYKTQLYRGTCVIINRFEPTTNKCSHCKNMNIKKLTLGERTFVCEKCGFEIDRDLNAALNILTAGLAEINACGLKGSTKISKKSSRPSRVKQELTSLHLQMHTN